MVFVDPRGGSCELVKPLRALGLPVDDSAYLPAGDIMFEGKGIGGRPLLVGIEYKKLPDFISSVRTERLQGIQLPGMVDAGYDVLGLFIEGELLYDQQGKLLRYGLVRGRKQLKPLEGGMGVGELLKRVYVLHLCGGMLPWWTASQRDTVTAIQMLYRLLTDCNLDDHTSHLGSYTAPTLVPISDFRALVMKLPGVGIKASSAIEKRFNGCLAEAFNAPAKTWASIETRDSKGKTRKIGLAVATRIVDFIHKVN